MHRSRGHARDYLPSLLESRQVPRHEDLWMVRDVECFRSRIPGPLLSSGAPRLAASGEPLTPAAQSAVLAPIQMRKPDPDVFRLALQLAQVTPPQVAYIENTPMFVQIAEGLGIHGILHKDYVSTSTKLVSLGLGFDKGAIRGAR